MRLDCKVALVTGAASGLGAACAKAVVEAGGYAVIADIDRAKGLELAKTLSQESLFLETDVSNPASLEATVAATLDRFGRIDAAIACAGILAPARVLGKDGPMALDTFERTIRVNLIGSFNLARLAAAAMARNEPDEGGERGVIVLTSSVAAFEGQIGQCAYSASKGGVASMVLPLARDLGRSGIRVLAIAPGVFNTPMVAFLPEEARMSLTAGVPFPTRLGEPAEFAALARHLMENRYLNGEVIRLDAGLRMGPR